MSMNMYLDGQQAHLTPDHMGFMVYDRLRKKQTRVREAVKNLQCNIALKCMYSGFERGMGNSA